MENPESSIPVSILEIKDELDSIARDFEGSGYRVFRIPIVFWLAARRRGIRNNRANLTYFSYKNAHVWQLANDSEAIVPGYHDICNESIPSTLNEAFSALDTKACNLYGEAGFKSVNQVLGPLLYRNAKDRGSIHCLVKVLERKLN